MTELESMMEGMTAHQLRRALIEYVQILGPEKEIRHLLDVLDVIKTEVPKSPRRVR